MLRAKAEYYTWSLHKVPPQGCGLHLLESAPAVTSFKDPSSSSQRMSKDTCLSSFLLSFLSLFFFLSLPLPSFCLSLWLHRYHVEVPGPGTESKHSCKLYHSSGSAKPFNHCTASGIEPVSPQWAEPTAVRFLTHCTTMGTPRATVSCFWFLCAAVWAPIKPCLKFSSGLVSISVE